MCEQKNAVLDQDRAICQIEVHDRVADDFEAVIVELREKRHEDFPAERDMAMLTPEQARELRDELNEVLDDDAE